MSVKKKVAGILCTALVLMSASAFAGATYSVKDEKVHEQLDDIRGQLEVIKKYLAVVEEKEKSMDLLEKNAADRTNDSMQKLSPGDDSTLASTASSFMSEEDANTAQGRKNINEWQRVIGLLGKGKGGFLEGLIKTQVAKGLGLSNFMKGLDSYKISFDDFMLQFDGISTGNNFDGLTNPSTITTVHFQNLQEIAKQQAEILNEQAAYDERKSKLDEDAKKDLEEISKAKDSKSDAKENLASAILGSRGKLVNTDNWQSLLSGKGINVGDLGSVLSSSDMKTIFLKDGTESTTGAQEKTTSVAAVQLSKQIRDAEQKAFHATLRIKLGALEALIPLEDLHYHIALGEAAGKSVGGITVNSKGVKRKNAFDKKYKD